MERTVVALSGLYHFGGVQLALLHSDDSIYASRLMNIRDDYCLLARELGGKLPAHSGGVDLEASVRMISKSWKIVMMGCSWSQIVVQERGKHEH